MLGYDPDQIPNLRVSAACGLGIASDEGAVFLRYPAQIPVREMVGRDDMAVSGPWARIFRYGQRARIAHCLLPQWVGRYYASEDRD